MVPGLQTPADHRQKALIRRGLTSFLLLVVFAWLAVLVWHDGTPGFDEPARDAMHAHALALWTMLALAFTYIGSNICLWPLVAALVVLFWRSGHGPEARTLLLVMTGALILEVTAKHIVQRTRPPAFFGLEDPGSYSFPSGHAMFAMCIYSTLARLMQPRVRRRALLWTAAAFFIVGIGLSRVYLGVHYPSDVLAGWCLGAAWTVAVPVRRDG